MGKKEVSGGSRPAMHDAGAVSLSASMSLHVCVCGRGRDVCEVSVVSETLFSTPGVPCRPLSQSLNDDHPPGILQEAGRSQTGPSRQVFRAAGRQ